MTGHIYWYDWNAITAGCKKHGNDAGCATDKIDIFDVAYEDAPGHVWTMCRCRDNSAVSEAVSMHMEVGFEGWADEGVAIDSRGGKSPGRTQAVCQELHGFQ